MEKEFAKEKYVTNLLKQIYVCKSENSKEYNQSLEPYSAIIYKMQREPC